MEKTENKEKIDDLEEDKKESKETNAKAILENEIFEDLNLIPLRGSDVVPLMKNWEKFTKKKYSRDKLKKHKGGIAVTPGEMSKDLVILHFLLNEAEKEKIKEIVSKIREINPVAGNTYIQEDGDNFYLFYYISGCEINSKTQWFPPKPEFANSIRLIKVYGQGDYCKIYNPMNNLTIKPVLEDDFILFLKEFSNVQDIFERVSVEIDHKPRGGIYQLISTKEGIIHRQTKSIYNDAIKDYVLVTYDKPILDAPFLLKEIYLSQNQNRRFYEVKIGDEKVCLPKGDLLNFIENERNYTYVSGKELKNSITPILRAYEKKKGLIPNQMYPTIGVFLNNESELVVVYPGVDDIMLYGENDYQRWNISLCEKKGLDEKGELTETYYHLIHEDTLPLSARIITTGYAGISPFFYALKGYLDIFPNLFWIGPGGTGKTTWLEIIINYLYGTEIKSAENINSDARFTKAPTSHTTPLNIDDLDKLGDEKMNHVKSISTRKIGRERMSPNQKLEREEIYASFSGSANSDSFLRGKENKEVRLRCLVLRDFKKIEESKQFRDLLNKIKTGGVFGYYFLKNALEFINIRYESQEMSLYEKMINFIEENVQRIKDFFQKNLIYMEDPRRYTIYALILVGLHFWKYIFDKHRLKSKQFNQIINLEKNYIFLDIVNTLEGGELSFSMQDFENIIEYYENPRSPFKRYYNNLTDKKIILGTDFISGYDKWARERGYETLTYLTSIAEMQSRLLMERIEVKMARVYDQIEEEQYDKPIRGVIFQLDKIKKRMGQLQEYLKKKERGSTKKITIEKMMIPDEEKVKEEKAIVKKIEEIFEANQFGALEEKTLKQTLDLEFDKDLIERTFEYLWDNEIINPDKNNDYLIYFNKENLLNLKTEGDGGGKEGGEM